MKKLFLSLFACAATISALGAPKTKTDTFPLMAWDYVDDKASLEAMRDGGITCVAFVRPNMLDACHKYGLQAIVFDESVAGTNWSKPYNGDIACENLGPLVKKTIKHPAVMGYHLKDEPHASEFPELAKAVAKVKELAPGKWPYINLFPGKGDSYDQYLEDFATICQPAAFSYDRYSLLVDNEIDTNFWSCLAQVRTASLKHKLPMWNIVLTSTHWGYRELTEADIRIQTWGSLVYGVKGLAYYKYISRELPILDAADLGNFRNGPLDQFGEKTPTWHWLRNVNRQIQNMAPILLKLRSDDVYHIGGTTMPGKNHGPSETSLVKSIKGECIVGDFTHEDGRRFVMVVNKSLKSSIPCMPEYNVTPKQVRYVSPITGETKPYKYPKYYFLAPGQGVLLELEL